MTINNERVAEIMQQSPTAEAFASYAAKRAKEGRAARNGVSTLPDIRSQMTAAGFHAVPEDMLTMFRELDRAGIGKLHGKRFRWSVPLTRIGELATEAGVASVKPLVKQPAREKPVLSTIPKTTKSLVVCLDKHREISIDFTPNLTEDEVLFVMEKVLQECK